MSQKYAKTLPIIATNYSGISGMSIRLKGDQAYTDGKEITIPKLNLTDPVKSRHAYGYLAHESAHVRYTDFKVVKSYSSQILKHALLNILEDARIERLIGSSFIGVWENLALLHTGENADWEKFVLELDNKPALQLVLGFLLCYTGSYSQRFKVLRARAALLFWKSRHRVRHRELTAVARLSLKILNARSTAEVGLITDAIFAVLNQSGCLSSPPEQPSRHFGKVRLRVGRNGRFCGSVRPGKELKKQCELLEGSLDHQLAGIVPGIPAQLPPPCEEPSDVESAKGYTVGSCRAGRRNFIYKTASSSYLRRILASKVRAWCECRGSQAENGQRINPWRASLVQIGETRIFYDRICERDHSTSIHMLVDVSGSMLSTDGGELTRCDAACRCALSLCMALENIDGIVTMCSFFPGFRHEIETALENGQRASARAQYFDQSPRGSTPLAQALRHAIAQASKTTCCRHIVLVLTDGIPDSLTQARLAVDEAKACGIECYGIGIRLDFIKSLIKDSVVIQSPAELDKAVFSLLSRVIMALPKSPS